MTTVEVLICTINKGVVRILDNLVHPRPDVKYIVSYQYTDERYLELVPQALTEREDVFSPRPKARDFPRTGILRLALQRATLWYLPMTTRAFLKKDSI